jgi:hypothetical protein
MPFLGVIKVKSDVAVTLTTKDTNKHVAILLVGLTVDPQGSKHAVIAPATTPTKESMLEIEVHFETTSEGAELRVDVDDEVRDQDDIHGRVVTWMYSCEK